MYLKKRNKIKFIINIDGTGKLSSSCGSWIKHWKNWTGLKANICAAVGCNETKVEGAHVRLMGSFDNNLYICPLCHKHNTGVKIVKVKENTVLALANKAASYDRWQ